MIECFVLAGGLSRRFGEDKLLYQIGGKRVIEYTLEALRGVCGRLCLVVKDKEKFSFLKEVEVVKDVIEKQFALAGLYTALENLKGDKALIVAGDMPLIRKEVVSLLLRRANPPITLFNINGKLYPLFAVYYKQVLQELKLYIKAGGEKVLDFVKRFPYKEIAEGEVLEYDPTLLSFLNMNTRTDANNIIKAIGYSDT
ncbi:MAG: molybdenum cofactor guanylyltransferase MobA [Aquificaceae bacterium]